MMRPSSPPARCVAAAAMTASSSIRPKFGRGPKGETWRIEEGLAPLLADVRRLIDADSSFVFLTVYAVRLSSLAIATLLAESLADLPGTIEYGDLAMREEGEGARLLPTAIFARWSSR